MSAIDMDSPQTTLLTAAMNSGMSAPVVSAVTDSAKKICRDVEDTVHEMCESVRKITSAINTVSDSGLLKQMSDAPQEVQSENKSLISKAKNLLTRNASSEMPQENPLGDAIQKSTKESFDLSACADDPTPGESEAFKVADQPEMGADLAADPEALEGAARVAGMSLGAG